MADNDDLLDYEDEEQTEQVVAESTEAPKKDVKGTYVSIHSSGFRDFLLKPEILRAIVDCGFEHPSEGKIFFNFFFLFYIQIYFFSSLFLQFNMNVFHKLFWVWIFYVKQNLVWEKQLYSSWLHYNSWNQQKIMCMC